MVKSASRRVEIISKSLEPQVYDTPDFLEAAKRLTISGRGRIRILLLDPEALISRGGSRLVDLAMRLSSFIEIRKPGPDDAEFAEAMLIVDRIGSIHRKYADRWEGIAYFNSPRLAVQLSERFESLWQNSETDPHFRRLML